MLVGLMKPRVGFVARDPVARLTADSLVDRLSRGHSPEKSHQGIGGPEHIGMRVGEADMLLHDGP